MTYVERALTFDCCGERLVGVMAVPTVQDDDVGVVVIVGGPQYRIGSHRQFLLLARRLAAGGIATLRFDYRGMGDSTGTARSFADVSVDIAAAIDALQAACPALRRIVLWGLCDAASAAAIYCETTGDPRVAGVALLNPWVRSDATMARAQLKHYYGRRLLETHFWSKLARGGVNLAGALRGVVKEVGAASARRQLEDASGAVSFQSRMASGLESFRGPVLIVLSERDLTAKEFVEFVRSDPPRWRVLVARSNVEQRELAEADHTFSTERWRREVEDLTLSWIRRMLLAEV